jgi:hypothetical protein
MSTLFLYLSNAATCRQQRVPLRNYSAASIANYYEFCLHTLPKLQKQREYSVLVQYKLFEAGFRAVDGSIISAVSHLSF